MEFEISLIVLLVFAVLMIGNALKTARESRREDAVPSSIAPASPPIDRHVSHRHHAQQRDAA